MPRPQLRLAEPTEHHCPTCWAPLPAEVHFGERPYVSELRQAWEGDDFREIARIGRALLAIAAGADGHTNLMEIVDAETPAELSKVLSAARRRAASRQNGMLGGLPRGASTADLMEDDRRVRGVQTQHAAEGRTCSLYAAALTVVRSNRADATSGAHLRDSGYASDRAAANAMVKRLERGAAKIADGEQRGLSRAGELVELFSAR